MPELDDDQQQDKPDPTENEPPKPPAGDGGTGSDDDGMQYRDGDDLDALKAKNHKANREAQNLRQRLKAAEADQAELQKIRDANLSTEEKLRKENDELKARAAAAERSALRSTIATDLGLSASMARRLVGETEEELRADAEDMLAEIGQKAGGKPPARKPAPRLRGGSDPEEEPEETDPAKLAAKIPRR